MGLAISRRCGTADSVLTLTDPRAYTVGSSMIGRAVQLGTGQMQYLEIAEMLQRLREGRGFSNDEPLDSLDRLCSLKARAPSWADIAAYACALASIQEWDRSEAVANSILDEAERGQALAILAKHLESAGLSDRAECTALSAPDTPGALSEKIEALLDVSMGRLETGDNARARALLSEAEARIVFLPLGTRAYYTGRAAGVVLKLGDRARALALLDQAATDGLGAATSDNVIDDLEIWKTLAWIAGEMSRAGAADRARELLRRNKVSALREAVAKRIGDGEETKGTDDLE